MLGDLDQLREIFQSTQPSQAVTFDHTVKKIHGKFQSTQPSQAVTLVQLWIIRSIRFQSTQPSQAVTKTLLGTSKEFFISIHTALAGCDPSPAGIHPIPGISIHTALAGCDWQVNRSEVREMEFQSTQPSQAVTIIRTEVTR